MKSRAPIWTIVVIALMLTACVAPAVPPVEQQAAETPSEQVAAPTPQAEQQPTTAPTTSEPQRGGTAILSTGEGFSGPAVDFDTETTHDIRLMALYMSPLMIQKQDGTQEPCLATDISLSDDGLKWTVKLHPDAKWHDGEPIVADDLIYTIEVIASGRTNPPALLKEFATIEGRDAFAAGDSEHLTGLTRVDDLTVEVTTVKPNVALRYQLGNLLIVPSHFWKDVPLDQLNQHPRWLDNPIGSGPFKMVAYTSDLTAEFEAFEDYFLGQPYLDKIIVRFAPADTALAGLEAGEVHYVPTINVLDAQRLESNPDITVGAAVRTTTWSLFNHMYHPELRDPRICEALTLAIDREAINQNVFGGFGGDQVKMWYYPGTWPANPELPIATYEPEKARQLLEEAGFDFEQHIGLAVFPSYAPLVSISEMIQANFADIGVQLDLYTIEESIITQEWGNKHDELWFTIATMGGTYPNPYEWWDRFRTDATRNWGFWMCSYADESQLGGQTPLEMCDNYIYGSEELDQLMDQALSIGDFGEAAPIMWEIDRLLWEQPPGIPVLNAAEIHAWSSKLHGIQPGEEYDLRHWRHAEQWWLEQ